MSKSDDEEKLLEIAKKQFRAVADAESENRKFQLDDQRFRAASPDNHYQWPEKVRNQRENDPSGQRPCLTINKIPHHVNQVTNDIRQNRPSLKVIPVDDKADIELAEILNGVIRHIQYASDADVAYDTAAENLVTMGTGYIRVATDYVDDDSFDQDICIKRVRNPFTVYMDFDSVEPDGSDARYVFVTEMISREEFKEDYPDAEIVEWDEMATGDVASQYWYHGDKIRIAEWWRVETEQGKLNLWESGESSYDDEDAVEKGYAAEGEEPKKTREVERRKVMCRKLCGHQILDEKEWSGKYIPIARAIGNEFDIEGKVYYSGIVRNAKDAQRMYNYWVSQEVEMLALAPKAPFIGYAGQFEGFEHEWGAANGVNYPYLQAQPVVDNAGTVLPIPQRSMPPMASSGILQAKAGAAEDIKTATGQFDASLGARSNETSGKAIMARQREGDTSTFHYVDNLSRTIRHVGRIIVDLIPKIYDVPRVARIMGEDGSVDHAQIDNSTAQAVTKVQSPFTQTVQKIYNPSIGKYDVAVTVGPSYTTKRQEVADTMKELFQANPNLWQVLGDKYAKASDWPDGDAFAKRLKYILLPQIQKDEAGEDQEEIPAQAKMQIQQMQQELQQTQAQLKGIGEEYNQLKEGHEIDLQKLTIDRYKAETERLKLMQPYLGPQIAEGLAQEFGMQVINSPDIYLGNDEEQMTGGPPQPMQQDESIQQPPQGGFLTPEG